MLLKRWLGLFLCVAASCFLAVSLVGAQAGGEDKLEWKAFSGKEPFYQLLESKTKQTMKVQGQEIIQDQNQTFLIKWTPKDKDATGNWVVIQTIEGVKLEIDIGGNKIKYDSTEPNQPNNPMTDFFKSMQNVELTYTIKTADMSVIKIDGRAQFVEKLANTNPQMQPLLNNILSEEALKKMAEPTWGIFTSEIMMKAKGATWPKSTTLDLGPIGTYETTYNYTYEGMDKNIASIKTVASLKYGAPKVKAGLPFTIKSAELSSKEGTGKADFNTEKGRFDRVSMKMTLGGTLKIDVGSQETDVSIEQTQDATATTSDAKPAAWDKKDTKDQKKQ